MRVLKSLIVLISCLEYSPSAAGHDAMRDGPYKQTYPNVFQNGTVKRLPLFFGLMMSFGGDVKSSGTIPGVQVALDAINNQPDLLPGYTLHYTLTDSQVRKKTSVAAILFLQYNYIHCSSYNNIITCKSYCAV